MIKNLTFHLYAFVFLAENYIVTMFTGDVGDAGTDSTIYITLFGSTGKSCGPVVLDNSYNNFGRGNIDTFALQCDYLGPIAFVAIGEFYLHFFLSFYLSSFFSFFIIIPFSNSSLFVNFADKDNNGAGPGWYLEKLSVYDERDWHVYSYVYNEWVDYHNSLILRAVN